MGFMMGMGPSIGGVHGTPPLWYVFGTVLVSAVSGGGYLVVQDDLTTDASRRSKNEMTSPADREMAVSPEGTVQGTLNPEFQPEATC